MGFGFVSGELMTVQQGTYSNLKSMVQQPNAYGSFKADVQVQRSFPSDSLFGSQTHVPNPGTAVALGTEHCDAVVVKALTGNTGLIYVGDSGVKASQFELNAKEAVTLGLGFIGSIWIDAANANEGVCYLRII